MLPLVLQTYKKNQLFEIVILKIYNNVSSGSMEKMF